MNESLVTWLSLWTPCVQRQDNISGWRHPSEIYYHRLASWKIWSENQYSTWWRYSDHIVVPVCCNCFLYSGNFVKSQSAISTCHCYPSAGICGHRMNHLPVDMWIGWQGHFIFSPPWLPLVVTLTQLSMSFHWTFILLVMKSCPSYTVDTCDFVGVSCELISKRGYWVQFPDYIYDTIIYDIYYIIETILCIYGMLYILCYI